MVAGESALVRDGELGQEVSSSWDGVSPLARQRPFATLQQDSISTRSAAVSFFVYNKVFSVQYSRKVA